MLVFAFLCQSHDLGSLENWIKGFYFLVEIMQETTATVLSAALASKKSEPPTFGTSAIGTSEQLGSSGTTVPSTTSQKNETNIQSSEATSSVVSEMAKVYFILIVTVLITLVSLNCMSKSCLNFDFHASTGK